MFLRAQPGYLATRLHRSLSPEVDFRFVNIGRYASPQAFRAAIGQPEFRKAAAAIQRRAHPGLYEVIRRWIWPTEEEPGQADANAPVFATGEIEVAADPERVWEVMADIGRWRAGTPTSPRAPSHGPVRPGTSFSWKSGPGTIRSTFQVVERPTELSWIGRTMGIPAIHVYRLGPSEQDPGHTVVRLEESWDGLLARLLRRPFTRTLQTAVDTGLAASRPRPSGKRRATPQPEPSRHQTRADGSAGVSSPPGSGVRSSPPVCCSCSWRRPPCWIYDVGPPSRSGAARSCGRQPPSSTSSARSPTSCSAADAPNNTTQG